MNLKSVSKKMSWILRHSPGDLKLSEGGWVDMDDFVKHSGIDAETVLFIVNRDEKKRYSYDSIGDRIRANQGHSVPIDMGFEEKEPPDILYHGTVDRFEDSIFKNGILKMSRQYVHLSSDRSVAVMVGNRRGSCVILEVDSKRMYSDGIKFYQSENGVWLVDFVPVGYFRKIVWKR